MLASLGSLADRAAGIARRSGGRLNRLGRRAGSDAAGMVQRVRHLRAKPKDLDDVTLARKVETELFRPADAPKGTVNVDAVDGVVTLRGQARTPDEKKALEAAARRVPEVRGVKNLLKLPKTASPTRADSPGRSKRTGGGKTGATGSGTGTGRFNREQSTAPAEPDPKELAAERKGRGAAPLGSEEPPTS